MQYRETVENSHKYKEEYVAGLDAIIQKRQAEQAKLREEYAKEIIANPEKARDEFKVMLGWPLTDNSKRTVPSVRLEKLSDEDGYTLYRTQLEVLDGLWLTGLFFKQNKTDPLVVVQHGGGGTPELISGAHDGFTGNYNDMLERSLKYGVHVFAPQLLLWEEKYGITFNRQDIDAKLKRVGSSITAIEVYAIQRVLDYFEVQDYVTNFGMVGLSYGGFYTLFTTAVDERIKSAISCAFFNSRDAHPWIDWTWFDFAKSFDDAEIALLCYPRNLCVQIADNDELFKCEVGVASNEKLLEYCKDVGTDWYQFVVFEGAHEFCKDDKYIEKLVNDIM